MLILRNALTFSVKAFLLFILLFVIHSGELVFQGKEAVDCSEIILTMQGKSQDYKVGCLADVAYSREGKNRIRFVKNSTRYGIVKTAISSRGKFRIRFVHFNKVH